MATSEQAIRVTAKGEFGQLQRGLKDLQGDLKNVLGEIDKGARKGGFFDDSSLRALDTFNKRLKDTMGDLDKQFQKQNDLIDKLTDNMKRANAIEKIEIQDQIKSREKELDVIRRQILEVERLHKKRMDEASSYEIKPSGSSGGSAPSGGSGGSLVTEALSGTVGKIAGAASTIAKFAMGLAGITSIMSLAQDAYQIAYQRQVGSLDLGQRIRGYGYSGSSYDMYNQAADVGRRDKMGYKESETWAFLDAYTSRGGMMNSAQQYGVQKFARGYGLDLNSVGSMLGGVKQLGGTVQPKQFADMIAGSVSQSGMLPRIMEVMQAHTTLLQNINTTFKDGSSSQILAYQTTLDKLGNQNGMTKLTGQQGASVISGLNGIFQPNNDKWQWLGISALQQYNPKKYGNMGLYDLQENFEDGLQNPDNIPAMAKYLRGQSGGNETIFKRLMQSWLQDGGFNATKTQVDQLDKVTNGFTAFDKSNIEQVMKNNAGTDSGAKYTNERENETGQSILDTEANFEKQLGNFGDKYILPNVMALQKDFTKLMEDINKDAGFSQILKDIDNSKLKYILDAIIAVGAVNAVGTVGSIISKFKGRGGGGGGTAGEEEAAEEIGSKATGKGATTSEDAEFKIGKDLKVGDLSKEEHAALDELSGGNPEIKGRLEQIYRSTGDMDAVKHATSGNATAEDIIDMISNGDGNVQKQLTEHYGKTGDLAGTMDKAKELTQAASTEEKVGKEGGFFSKFFKGGVGKASEVAVEDAAKMGKFAKFASVGGKVLDKVPIVGGLMDFGLNLLGGDSVGRSASRATGSGLGGWGGAAAGAGIGTMIFPGVGTVIGGIVGGIGGGLAGDKVGGGAFDFFTNSKEKTAAAQELVSFSQKGTLDIDGLSTQGVQKLDEMKQQGLLNFVDMKTSSTATLSNMTDEGKKDLLQLQKEGLVSIGGLQKDGTTKITALSDDGKTALQDLKKSGEIQLSDFQTTGKVKITALSESGAKSLLDLQKDGSATLTSMSSDTSDKLKEIKEDTGSKMDDIVTEHKGFLASMKDFFGNMGTSISDWFSQHFGGGSSSGSGNTTPIKPGAAGANTDVRAMSSVTADQLNSKFKGALYGHGQDFIDAGQKYGIDPAFLAAISMHETGNGSSNAINRQNNVAGMMGKNGLMSFDSIQDGINAEAANLVKLYINDGLLTPEQIQKRYAPVGAANDPNGLNSDWLNGVVQFWKQLGGGNYVQLGGTKVSGGYSGGGGFGDSSMGIYNSAGNNMPTVISPFGDFRGYDANGNPQYHHGLDIAASQGSEVDALKGGQISFLNMDDGGQYDSDGKANSREGGTELGIKMLNGSTYFYSHLSNINPDILKRWQSGDRNIAVNPGDFLANSGGAVGALGSGYGSTGSHLHIGYMDGDGVLQDPMQLFNGANSGGSLYSNDVHVTVDVNLKGEGASQLNNMTLTQLKSLIEQTVEAIQRRKLSMNPTVRK